MKGKQFTLGLALGLALGAVGVGLAWDSPMHQGPVTVPGMMQQHQPQQGSMAPRTFLNPQTGQIGQLVPVSPNPC